MAVSEGEVCLKGVHCMAKLEYRPLKSRQNLKKKILARSMKLYKNWTSSSCIFQLFCLDNANILVYFSQFAQIFRRSDVFIKKTSRVLNFADQYCLNCSCILFRDLFKRSPNLNLRVYVCVSARVCLYV